MLRNWIAKAEVKVGAQDPSDGSRVRELEPEVREQAPCARKPNQGEGLIHHSDRGSQYVSIRYGDRLLEAGIDASVGNTGDSYDNALAETINGLYKTEVVRKKGPWRTIEALEWETLPQLGALV